MIYFYGIVFMVALYFLIKEAVSAGVESALTSEDVEVLLSSVVSRGIEMERQNREEYNDKH